jgi:hypothetical protein
MQESIKDKKKPREIKLDADPQFQWVKTKRNFVTLKPENFETEIDIPDARLDDLLKRYKAGEEIGMARKDFRRRIMLIIRWRKNLSAVLIMRHFNFLNRNNDGKKYATMAYQIKLLYRLNRNIEKLRSSISKFINYEAVRRKEKRRRKMTHIEFIKGED